MLFIDKEQNRFNRRTDEHLASVLRTPTSIITRNIEKLVSNCKQHHIALIWRALMMNQAVICSRFF
jgi:hypothetical protein